MNLPFPMTPRETVVLGGNKVEGDTYLLFGCSVEFEDAPPDPKFLRAHSTIGYTVLTPAPGGKTVVTSIGHTDPRGMIPALFLNTMIKHSTGQNVKAKRDMAAWALSH
eukprot:TRINITY_DN1263_c0_g1_i1.p1 TRINITY_DN1263_c0_g1~~TRINITY_DN1263_c0_g1_i1.p1  ORF type:complete len:121 (-),score=39.39 TRINITY_DN1263_c0_g1_i1:50-373(-)